MLVAAHGPQAKVELQFHLVPLLPRALDLQVGSRHHLLHRHAVDRDLRLFRPFGAAHEKRQDRCLRRLHLDFHGSAAWVVRRLNERPRQSVIELNLRFSGPVVVQIQAIRAAENRPLAEQPQPVRAVDAAAVQLGRAGPRLEHDPLGGCHPLAVHGRVVGTPAAGRMLVAEHGIPRRQLERVGNSTVVGQSQRLDAQRHPSHGTARLDRARLERIADRLLTRTESAVIVNIGVVDAPPPVEQRLPVRGIPSDTVEFGKSEHRVQALPARLGRLIKLDARQTHPMVIACGRLLPILFNLAHQPQVRLFLGFAVKKAEHMDHGHIHLLRSCVVNSLSRIQKGRAQEVGRTRGSPQRVRIARILMPEAEGEHAVVMSP